ncbi:MAG: hypothetical protein KJO59_04300, partial [Ignavibacteria bacterium]|nr:hypothetical protein [Ignavibacteria bacterium]
MKKYFSKHYAQINEIYPTSEKSIKKWYEGVIDIYDRNFMPYVDSLENKEVLELGCGIGGLLFYLKSIG